MDPSLYDAATSGDVGFLQRIRDGNVSTDVLSQKTPKDNNAFHLAAEFKQIAFFKDVPLDKRSPLFWATNKTGDTPMHIAARVGCGELVDFLIENAKSLHIRTASDQERGPTYSDPYKELLRKTNTEMHTALHVAARYGHRAVVTSLMNADLELCCSTYSTKESPLFLATCKGFYNIARDILNQPISPSFQGINGVTALHAAVTHTYTGVEDLVKMMVSKYPDDISPHITKEADALGWTPLHYAAFRGNLKAITLLMDFDKSSTSYILDKFGMSALHIAAYKGHTEVMDKLIEIRPDTCECLNAKDQTVLHVAVLGARSDVVEHILKQPNLTRFVDQTDKEGNTPLHLAVFGQNHEITKMLTLDCRVDSPAIDKGFSLAFDNFLGEDINIQTASGLGNGEKEDPNLPPSKAEQDRDEGSLVALRKGSDKLGRSFGVPLFHEQISRDFKKFELLQDQNKDSGNKDPGVSTVAGKLDIVKSEFNLLIAVLITTVTFTAALAPPGGYNDDGKTILQDNTFFRWFQAVNLVSFLLSVLVLVYESFVAYFGARIAKVFPFRPRDLISASLYGMVGAVLMAILATRTEPRKSMSVDRWIKAAACGLILIALGPGYMDMIKRMIEIRRKKKIWL